MLETAEDGWGWECRGWRRLFRVRWGRLATPAEQRTAADGKDTFTDAELMHLYATANDRQRLLLLFGLNTAMNQKELATLAAEEVDFTAGTIARIRHKTRSVAQVRVVWSLWPETRTLLRRHLAAAEDNPAGLALLTQDGRPLVDDTTDTDSVALSWGRLLRACTREERPVRALSYGVLRKTVATWVLNHSGEPVQELLLGHAGRSVARRHYTGRVDFAPLHAALDAYRRHLLAAGVFPAAAPDAAPQNG